MPRIGCGVILTRPDVQWLCVVVAKVSFIRRNTVRLHTVEVKFDTCAAACPSKGDMLPNIIFSRDIGVNPS